MTYLVHFQIPKGFYNQFTRLAIIKGLQYRTATKINSDVLKIQFEDIDPLYPKKSDGSVDWIVLDTKHKP